jgi:hypothetical protein
MKQLFALLATVYSGNSIYDEVGLKVGTQLESTSSGETTATPPPADATHANETGETPASPKSGSGTGATGGVSPGDNPEARTQQPSNSRKLFVSLIVGMLCLGTTACGGASKSSHLASRTTSTTIAYPTDNGATTTSGQHYLNDGDAEKKDDGDLDNREGNHEDGDADSSEEYETTYDNGDYHDSDDGPILNFGRAASVGEKQAIMPLVKRFYTAAVHGDGAAACSIMLPSLARSVAGAYGQSSGPSYLRGGESCAAIMSLLFAHFRAKLAGEIGVTNVLVKGNMAFVLIGSMTMPASYLPVEREDGHWWIAALIGRALP